MKTVHLANEKRLKLGRRECLRAGGEASECIEVGSLQAESRTIFFSQKVTEPEFPKCHDQLCYFRKAICCSGETPG